MQSTINTSRRCTNGDTHTVQLHITTYNHTSIIELTENELEDLIITCQKGSDDFMDNKIQYCPECNLSTSACTCEHP